jgi:hypothetical protein
VFVPAYESECISRLVIVDKDGLDPESASAVGTYLGLLVRDSPLKPDIAETIATPIERFNPLSEIGR